MTAHDESNLALYVASRIDDLSANIFAKKQQTYGQDQTGQRSDHWMASMSRMSVLLFCSLALSTAQGQAGDCAPPPTPVRDISAERFYTDAQYSVADDSANARNKDSLVELDGQLRKVINDSNAWLAKLDEWSPLPGQGRGTEPKRYA